MIYIDNIRFQDVYKANHTYQEIKITKLASLIWLRMSWLKITIKILIVVTLIIFLNLKSFFFQFYGAGQLALADLKYDIILYWHHSVFFSNFLVFLLIQQDFFGQVFLLVFQDASSNIKREFLEGLKPILMFQVLQGGSLSVSNMVLRTQCLNLPLERSIQFTFSEVVGLIALPAFGIEFIWSSFLEQLTWLYFAQNVRI